MNVYPPPVLFKYMTLSNIISGRFTKEGGTFRGIDALKEMIVDKKIWYSKPGDFNDPFEFKNYRCVGLKNCQVEKKKECDSSISYGESVLTKLGIICFCTNCTDIRMWSHYADGHRGICIRVKCEPSPFFDNRLYNVTYDDNITEFEIDLKNPNDNEYFLHQASTKASCWQYEDEYRIVEPPSNIHASDGYGLKQFPAELIEGIIFGLKTPNEYKAKIVKIVDMVNFKINLYQANQIPNKLKLKIVEYEK